MPPTGSDTPTPASLSYAGPGIGPSVHRMSLAVAVVAANYALFTLGVFCDSFGGEIDRLGAKLCRATIPMAGPLVIFACLYSSLRRFVLPKRRWDLYGPSLAAIGYLAMHALMRERPWWLPIIPGW